MTVATTVFPAVPGAQKPRAQDGHDLVAVDNFPALVRQDHAVGVSVERDADGGTGPAHLSRHFFGMQGPAAVIDIAPVRLGGQHGHVRAQLGEHLRRDPVGGAVGTIDHHAHAVEGARLGERVLEELHVAAFPVVDANSLANVWFGSWRGGLGVAHAALDVCLHVVGQLETVGSEYLDAVVLIGIVRGTDHHARVGAHAGRDEGDGRRGHGSDQHDVSTRRHDSRLQRAFQHVAGQARVLADNHPAAPPAPTELLGHRAPKRQGDLRRHRVLVGDTPNSIGAEESSCFVCLAHKECPILVELAGLGDSFGHANHIAHGRDIVNPYRVRAVHDRHGHGRGRAEDPLGRRLAGQIADESLARHAHHDGHAQTRPQPRQMLEQAQVVVQVLAKANAGIGPDFAAPGRPRRSHAAGQLARHFLDHVIEMDVGLHVGRLAAQMPHHHGGLPAAATRRISGSSRPPDTSLTAVAPAARAARAVAAL